MTKVEERAFWLGCATLFHEIRRATTQQLDAGLTQVKLGWWQQALSACKNKKPDHPVLLALGENTANTIPDLNWNELINKGIDSCEPQRYNTLADWHAHLTELILPWKIVIEAKFKTQDTTQLIQFWVYSTQLTQLLRLAKYIDQNFQPIPINLLQEHTIPITQLQKRTMNAALAHLLKNLTKQILNDAQTTWRALNQHTQYHTYPLLALFKMRAQELRIHHNEDFQHFLKQQHVLSPSRKFFTAWSAFVFKR